MRKRQPAAPPTDTRVRALVTVPPDHRQAVDDLLESVEAFDLSRLRDILACGRAAPVILEPRALV
ncbi:MAG TPA: hypothetical protein VGN26_12650, partial [Armatimonadota bacterium]